jgi:hypothetical protein
MHRYAKKSSKSKPKAQKAQGNGPTQSEQRPEIRTLSPNPDFKLDIDNIDTYLDMSVQMHEEIKWINRIANLENKLDAFSKTLEADEESDVAEIVVTIPVTDDLYTEEYVTRRLSKLKSEHEWTESHAALLVVVKESNRIKEEIKVVFPLAMEGKEGYSKKMGDLHEARLEVEARLVNMYQARYLDLCRNMPKIYDVIYQGGDINTVRRCFVEMKSVMKGQQTSEQATSRLMKNASAQYGMPSSVWDPIRLNKTKK